MAAETEFTIGAKASCSDGPCGEVTRLIIDPAARTITHLVIKPEHEAGRARLVSLDLVDTAADEITLRCTLAEFGQLERAEETDLVEGRATGFGPGGTRAPMGVPRATRTVVEEIVPLGETQLRPGEHVHALDGEIGHVQGFLVDEGHRVTHVLLKEGHFWGRKEVAIPVSAVTGLEDGIRLNLTKKQVEDLPPAD
ncbi:MAG: PRC-barrel domain-containing protein [Streptosporangiaceae bacterium]